jgi:hypothetical protein
MTFSSTVRALVVLALVVQGAALAPSMNAQQAHVSRRGAISQVATSAMSVLALTSGASRALAKEYPKMSAEEAAARCTWRRSLKSGSNVPVISFHRFSNL